MQFASLREKLLKENKIQFYKEILDYMNNPYSQISINCCEYLEEIQAKSIILYIKELYDNDRSEFKSRILFGQLIKWQKTLLTFQELKEAEKRIDEFNLVIYDDNYIKSSNEIRQLLELYAKAKSSITKMENELCVDRYLDRVAENDFSFLISVFDEIHKKTEKKIERYKKIFIKKWNTTNVCNLIIHKQIRGNMDNQVCSLVPSKRNKTILFILDGLGMGQFLWSKNVVPTNKNFTYSENIFEWLNNNRLSEEYVLGAPLITDTAAGLCQIFTGETSKETRIFSSNMKKRTEKGNYYLNVKKEEEVYFKRISGNNSNSFTVDISSEGQSMEIFYCSKYDERNVSGFSKLIFDGAKVTSVVPWERVFSMLPLKCVEMDKGAIVVYITSIDNSGHTMGSFSQFERYEHEKVNQLFKNFLIGLAQHNPEIFDGNMNLMITADHGMTESYRINISQKDIREALNSIHQQVEYIIEDNRAELLYGVSGSLKESKAALEKYFEEKSIEMKILIKGDDLFDSFIPDVDDRFDNTSPDLVMLLVSEGIFHSKEVKEELMHFGGHGGHSFDEVFVPNIQIELNSELLDKITDRFLKLD